MSYDFPRALYLAFVLGMISLFVANRQGNAQSQKQRRLSSAESVTTSPARAHMPLPWLLGEPRARHATRTQQHIASRPPRTRIPAQYARYHGSSVRQVIQETVPPTIMDEPPDAQLEGDENVFGGPFLDQMPAPPDYGHAEPGYDSCCGGPGFGGSVCEGCCRNCGANYMSPGLATCLACLSYIGQNWKQRVEINAGVNGFKGPVSGGDSSFGFHEGMNLTVPLGFCHAFGWQLGFEATHSNFDGADFSNGTFRSSTDDNRNQLFLTTGFYHRTHCGLQFGVVWDYLHESWDENLDLGQIRGKISWNGPTCHEIGFWFTANTTDAEMSVNNVNIDFETTDIYSFFYRYTTPCGGYGQMFAGWSGEGDGLIGADLELPISCRWALRSEFAYLNPGEDLNIGNQGYIQESWNVGFSLVWYPGCNVRAKCCSLARPYFRVANNSRLFTDFDAPLGQTN